MNTKFATIDIGTNTILMLIAEQINDNNFKVIADYHNIARLGEDFTNTNKKIIPEAKNRAIKILKDYRTLIEKHKVDKVFAVATSAVRESENSKDVINEFQNTLGYPIKIISGEQEAFYSYLGAVNKDDLDTLVIDIGGGSTEIIIGKGLKIEKRISYDIGAVKLTKMYIPEHPPTENQLNEMSNFIKEKLLEQKINLDNSKKFKVYAVAGTPTTIAAVDLGLHDFNRDLIEGHVLTLDKIQFILKKFISVTIDEIVTKFKVHPKRADVITAGTKLLFEILKFFNLSKCIASTKGLRYGMMKSVIFNKFNNNN